MNAIDIINVENFKSELTIEHIFSQKHHNGRSRDKKLVHRLGNLTLETKARNLALSNKEFVTKVEEKGGTNYLNSPYLVTTDLADKTTRIKYGCTNLKWDKESEFRSHLCAFCN